MDYTSVAADRRVLPPRPCPSDATAGVALWCPGAAHEYICRSGITLGNAPQSSLQVLLFKRKVLLITNKYYLSQTARHHTKDN